MIIDWPDQLDRLTGYSWFLEGTSTSPGKGLDGREQVIWRENRVWSGDLNFATQQGAPVALWHSIFDRAKGRSTRLRFNVRNDLTLTSSAGDADFWAQIGMPADDVTRGFIQYSDGTNFSDGTGFALPSSGNPIARRSAPAGSSVIRLDGFIGMALIPGAYFSVNDFLYRVAENLGGGAISFNPPLRQSISRGDVVEVNNPRIQVRLASDGEGRRPFGLLNISEGMSVSVTEAFTR